MNRTRTAGALGIAHVALIALAACESPGSPAPTPERIDSTATHTVLEWPPPELSSTSTAEPAPTATATATASAEPTATASATASAEPAPSASGTASPVVKGFAFPSPKSGILTVADADKVLKTGAHPKVRVLDAGKEPLAKIAFTATKGDKQPLRLDIDQKVATVLQGQTTAVTSPPQALDVEVETGDVDDQTGALVKLTLGKLSLKPVDGIDADTLGALQKQISGLNGYVLRERVSPSGAVSDMKAELPAAAPKGAEVMISSMNDIFRSMLPTLPEDAVGVGAKWQALSREDHGGANVMQLAEYTLKERNGTKITLGFSARQLAAGAEFKLPMAPPEGTTTQLTRFVSTMSGSLVVDTKEIAPIKGRSTQDTKVGIDVLRKADGAKLSTETTMKAVVTFARRGGASSTDAPAAPSGAPSAAPAPTATAKDAPAKP